MTAIYSATDATLGRFWVNCQDALSGDRDAIRRLMTTARGSADPVQERLAEAARIHLAIVAQRHLKKVT